MRDITRNLTGGCDNGGNQTRNDNRSVTIACWVVLQMSLKNENTEEKLKQAVQLGTCIIFLNQQWLGRLKDILSENDLLDESTARLIAHAKQENREAFEKINSLVKL